MNSKRDLLPSRSMGFEENQLRHAWNPSICRILS